MPERHDILPNRSKASYSDPTRHGYPDPYAPTPAKTQLPASVVTELVAALEMGHAALDAHLDATPEEQEANWTNAHTALSRMHSALAVYRTMTEAVSDRD